MSQTAIDPLPELMSDIVNTDEQTYQRLFRWLLERRQYAIRYMESSSRENDLRAACIIGVKECNKEIKSILSIPIE